jgi:hypothetical protein
VCVCAGVIGARCSGPSMTVARVAQLEHVPQISFSATSQKLSDTAAFPYFFRTVAPEGPGGGMGAMVRLLRKMGWTHIGILYTDKTWPRDTVSSFSSMWLGHHHDYSGSWEGTIGYSKGIKTASDGTVHETSLKQVGGPFPSWNRSILTEIYLCPACSCQEILRAETGLRHDPRRSTVDQCAGHLPRGSC